MKRWWYIGGAFLFALLVSAVLVVPQQKPPPPIFLPDGSQLTFLDVSFGTQHSYFTNRADRFLRFVPSRWRRLFFKQSTVHSFTTDSPSLGLWFRLRPQTFNGRQLTFAFLDENGFENEVSGSSQSFSTGTESLEGYGFKAFPRHSRFLTLRVYQRDARWDLHRGGEFKIPNPGVTPQAKRTPPPVSLSATNNNLAVELTQLLMDVQQAHPAVRATNGLADSWNLAAFRIRKNGAAATNWLPVGLELEDASGNRVSMSHWSTSSSSNEILLCFRMGLWPGEQWKLKVGFAKASHFLPEEVWSLPPLPLPSPAGVVETNLEHAIGHSLIRVKGIAGLSGRFPNDQSSWGGSPALRLDVIPPPKGTRLDVASILDDRAIPVPLTGSGWGDGKYNFGLNPAPESRTVSVTLALHPVYTMEFLAEPRFPKQP